MARSRNNPIARALEDRGIRIPDEPADFSTALAAAGVQRTYLICMTGRCGSTWLASTLAQLPHCGQPFEYLSEEAIPALRSARWQWRPAAIHHLACADAADQQVFGLKIDGMRLGWLSEICDLGLSFSPRWTAWVDMRRRLNIVKQGFSFARAKASGVWRQYASEKAAGSARPARTNTSAAPVEDGEVWNEMVHIVASEKRMDETYRSVALSHSASCMRRCWTPRLSFFNEPWHTCSQSGTCRYRSSTSLSDTKACRRRRNNQEIDFVERHAKQINALYEIRNASESVSRTWMRPCKKHLGIVACVSPGRQQPRH